MPLIAEFLPGHGTVAEMDRLNVFKHITRDFPPVFMGSGTGDFLKIQMAPYVEKLLQYGIPFCARFYTDGNRELGHDFCCNMKIEKSMEVADELCAFFRKYC